MTSADRKTLFAWALLVVATLCSTEIFGAAGFGSGRRAAGVIVLLIAFAKVRVVGREFMEIRHGPWALRLLFDAWLAGLAAVLLVLYAGQPA